ncbi:MAG TPA: hypothetical protein VGC42_22060 [Kofleriaceae bacterium]
MSGRLAPVAAIALAVGLAGLLGGSCYHVPEPGCGFVCGPDGACPGDYTCADDHRCHRNGTPASLVCATLDAAPDAAVDAAIVDAASSPTPAAAGLAGR